MKNNKRYLITAVIAVVTIVAVIIGIYLFRQSQGPSGNISLSGGAKGKGVSFFASAQLQADPDSSTNVKLLAEYYPGTKNTKTTLVATTSTAVDPANKASQLSQALKSRSGDYYLKFSSTLGTFIQDVSASGPLALNVSDVAHNQLTLKPPVNFTNKHIKSNAWRFDYSTTRPSPKDQKITVDGTLIYAFGKKAVYRLLISSVSDSWQTNQATWKKTTDSLTIDR